MVGDLRPSSIHIVGDQILLTAYSNKGSSNGSLPDGYIVSLIKDASDNNTLVKNLPYANRLFKLTSLGNTIYAAQIVNGFSGPDPEFHVVSAPSEALKSQVKDYLQKNVPGYEKYKLVYGENL